MPKYFLRASDGDYDVAVPDGETILGRGSFLQVMDKRVSRSHAKLELSNGVLRLLPTHSNPCFHASQSSAKRQALKRNEWQVLEDGAVMSLLPNDCVFTVVLQSTPPVSADTDEGSDTDIDEEMQQAARETKSLHSAAAVTAVDTAATTAQDHKPSPPRPVQETPAEEAQPTKKTQPAKSPASAQVSSSPVKSPGVSTAANQTTAQSSSSQPQATRQLPAWLLAGSTKATKAAPAAAAKQATKAKGSSRAPSSKKKALKDYSDSDGEGTTKAPPPSTKRSLADFSDSDGERKSLQPKAKRKLQDYSDSDDAGTRPPASAAAPAASRSVQKPTARPGPRKDLADFSDSDDEQGQKQAAPRPPAAGGAGRKRPPPKDYSDSDISEEERQPLKKKRPAAADAADSSSDKTLPPCQFGAKCYRKNPQHFLEYSHPDKNDDGNDGSQGDNGNDSAQGALPECPYGQLCYRKNPAHRREYAHNLPGPDDSDSDGIRRSRRKRKPARTMTSLLHGDSDDDGEPNAYDYNDSFLDDSDESASELSPDDSEDSEWAPASDSDVKELVSEAKGFLRNKKMHKHV